MREMFRPSELPQLFSDRRGESPASSAGKKPKPIPLEPSECGYPVANRSCAAVIESDTENSLDATLDCEFERQA